MSRLKGFHHTEETKRKLSLATTGKKRSEATKKKISEIAKNRTFSEETRRKLTLAQTGNHKALGYKHSEETRRKESISRRGNKYNLGHKASEDTRRKISEAQKGRKRKPLSEETKQKLSESRKGKYAGPNHPNWKGGIAYAPYCYKFNGALKEEIREKFGRKCFMCGIPENGRKLDVHHCDYNKGQGCGQRWALVPLCKACHLKTNYDRHYYFNLLSNYWASEYFYEGVV